MPLALLSPAAAAAVQARKQLARAAAKQQQEQQQEAAAAGGSQASTAGSTSTAAANPVQAGGAAAAASSEEDEDEYGMAAELALDADEVFEVPDDDDASSLFVDEPQQGSAAGMDDADDGEVLVRQRSEADVRAGLRVFEGMRQTLPPEQRRQQRYGPTTARANESPQDKQQQQQQQRAQRQQAAGLGVLSGHDADASGAEAADGEALEQELPLLTSWLQGGPPAATAERDQQQPNSPAGGAEAAAGSVHAADRPKRAPSAGTQRPRQSAVQSVFAGKRQAGKKERQGTQQPPPAASEEGMKTQAGSSRRPRRTAQP
jgi:hypothetical protein